MTSSIPMFIPNIILDKNVYFENCITDSVGFIEKIKDRNFLNEIINCNPNSSDCFDVKLYHARNNLYKKEIYFKNIEDKKLLYLLNTLKMAVDYTANMYCNAFRLTNVKVDKVDLYRQDASTMFDEGMQKTESYTCILFLDYDKSLKPFKISNGSTEREIFPKAGSVIILSPEIYYNIGYFMDIDRHYCIYNFKADII